MNHAHDFDFAVAKIENLHWVKSRTDTVAAAQFLCFNLTTGERIGVFDCYLLANGHVDLWEDLAPDSDTPVYRRPDHWDDWLETLTPMFKAALQQSVAR